MNTESYRGLLKVALEVREKAYAPYSRFSVGAAVMAENGSIYSGVNVENASYGLTVCAERSAIYAAVSAGERKFSALAVAADTSPPPAPCGACRQVLWELAGDIAVITSNPEGNLLTYSLSELIPHPFTSFRVGREP